ncbi:MFS transporter [Mycolicibacterium novocastrense]|nr:MFS transporter [Mycolicibacterium novocastrense]
MAPGRVRANATNVHPALALIVIAAAQLMVTLDNTIVNIALPSIQTELGVAPANLAWIVNAYALAFGGLLLLGGKSGDLYGRRRMFRIGISLFVIASTLGGCASGQEWLIAARVIQGIGGAIAAPTALALIAVNFSEGAPRNRAMAVYAAMAGLGATVGLLLGGVLTEYLNWRWVFFVNIPIGLLVLAGTVTLAEGRRNEGRLDLPGAITGTGGLLAFVYAITRGGQHGWSDALTVGCFATAAVLLGGFLWWQTKSTHPMLPLRLFGERSRAGSYATMLCIGGGMFATFYFLSLYMQQILGLTPVRTGLAYLPFSIGMGVAAAVSSKLVARVAPRILAGTGLVIAASGMTWLSTLQPESSYIAHLMPAMFVIAAGLGLVFVPMTLGAVSKVGDQDSGVASALLNTSQQVGGALGLAILTTIATSVANHRMPDAASALYRGLAVHDPALIRSASSALTDGYTTAFAVSAVFFLAGLLVSVVAINARPQQPAATATHM